MFYARRCFAKINLFLKVLGRREDGYHQLDTLFQEIDLSETLTWRLDDQPYRLRVTGGEVGPAAQNLITRAVRAFEAEAGVAVTGLFSLEKRIPTGGGLGGGSANAAHTLMMLNQHHGEPLDRTALHRLAVGLGADVPFFLIGGTCRGGGIGEELSPVTWTAPTPGGFLILPPYGVPTASVFRALAAPPLGEACAGHEPAVGENDLWPPVARLFPELAALLAAWPREGDEACFMTGSGSTLVHLTDTAVLSPAQQAVLTQYKAEAVPFRFRFL
ncbi:4-(cytidine 5'-diphospho)-2-C-methyl-D-erythritol kinase [Acanthopleuribacter pedis]|uniref:4-diphosphocytidyl-2-C-methyl-D-erythritol kinase n=1 Tax=Acanthopleuribacter pedis TaxID=442870 RepID=A0A8J7QGJ6_9BACT|nr:4-(cytidine 5'-diphospho)-2-C-methyl-D-erythritol kinase [Acanthopleuribacter pedis]MBO1319946.1 4-(cytidine 5'-diphospho)-2-C-methyl-D-erythritol kinase [Acanthopleuribacter pedis]